MAYYYQNEATEDYAGFVCIGEFYADDDLHNKIIALSGDFLTIANRYCIDLEPSRKAGTAVYAPLLERVSIGMALSHRAEDVSLAELSESKFVIYWLNFFGKTNLSAAETVFIAKEVSRLVEQAISKEMGADDSASRSDQFNNQNVVK